MRVVGMGKGYFLCFCVFAAQRMAGASPLAEGQFGAKIVSFPVRAN